MTSMDRDRFVAGFQDSATHGLAAGISTFEQLYVEEIKEGADDVLYAVSLVVYGGRPYRFRRQFWPTDRDADLAAAMYVTELEQALRARITSADADPNAAPGASPDTDPALDPDAREELR